MVVKSDTHIIGGFAAGPSSTLFLLNNGYIYWYEAAKHQISHGSPMRLSRTWSVFSDRERIVKTAIIENGKIFILFDDDHCAEIFPKGGRTTVIPTATAFPRLHHVLKSFRFSFECTDEQGFRSIYYLQRNWTFFKRTPSRDQLIVGPFERLSSFNRTETFSELTGAIRKKNLTQKPNEQLFITAVLPDPNDKNFLFFFLAHRKYIKFDTRTRTVGEILALTNRWTGVLYDPYDPDSLTGVLELVRLICDETTDSGEDEVFMQVFKNGKHIENVTGPDGDRTMNEIDTAEEAADPKFQKLARWELNQRYFFKPAIRISVFDRESNDKQIIGGITAMSLGESEYRQELLTKGGGRYKLIYKLNFLRGKSSNVTAFIVEFRFFHDHFVKVTQGIGSTTVTGIVERIGAEIQSACKFAEKENAAYNKKAEEEFEDRLRDELKAIGLSAVPMAVSAGFIAGAGSVTGGVAAGTGAIAGAAMSAVAVTGGVAIALAAATVAITLPIYFATLKSSISIIIANNLNVGLEIDRVEIFNGFQNAGSFESSLIPSNIEKHISLGIFSFEKFDGLKGLSGEIHFKPKSQSQPSSQNTFLEQGIVLKFEIPFSGNNTAHIDIKGNSDDRSISVRSNSSMKFDSVEIRTPNLLVSLSEV